MDAKPLCRTLDFRPMEFVRGTGASLFTEDGSRYLDFFADVGTASLGYCSREARDALDRMVHEEIPIHSPNLFQSAERNKAARALCESTGMDRVFFCSSGAEAVEAAIKAARKFHYDNGDPRYKILTAEGGFHGRTLGALAAGDGPVYHNEGYGPQPEGFIRALAEDTNLSNLREDLAAVMLAPVFGNNDVRLYPEGFLKHLREQCDRHGTLLIFDEVQTGSGRTGMATYAQLIGVEPDIITLAKGIAMGAPVGATLFRGPVADTFTPGSHFSTFGGNPLSCVMVNAMQDWLKANGASVTEKGNWLRKMLPVVMPTIRNVRGVGMLIAFDTDADCITLARECEKRGLLIGAFREGPGPVKITPPLNVTLNELNEGLAILAEAHVAALHAEKQREMSL